MESPDPAEQRRTSAGERHHGAGPRGDAQRGSADGGQRGSADGRQRGSADGRQGGAGSEGDARRGSAGERLGTAGRRIGSAGKKVGQASKVGVSGFASASRKTAGVTGRFGKATGRRIRGLTGAQGAGESGLSRLIELGAVNAAGDTAFAVSLAGTVFFAVPSSQARDRVALFLVLTMAPFALMAPLIGPVLDRFRHGRRWAIGATLGLRGFLVWSLAASIHDSSTWLYPAALGCLVASKAYGVTRASAVPRLLPKDVTLVTANSRISLAGLAGATVGAGIAGAFAAIGPEWSLRWAALVYTIGLILAIRLPSRVDSPAGEEMTGTAGRDARRSAITAAVARGIRCNLGLRFVSGFLTMYLAFLLRDRPISGIEGAIAAGAVIAAAGLGNSLGTVTGSLLKARKPETVVLVVLLADAVVAIGVAVFYGFPMLIVLGLVAGLCSSLGKLSLDAMIQRDVPESVRTSVFARSETVLQLAWVLGGGCGILLPLIPRLGFGFLAAILALVVIVVIRYKPTAAVLRTRPGSTAPGPGAGGPRTGGPGGSGGSGGSGGTGGSRGPGGSGGGGGSVGSASGDRGRTDRSGPPEPRTGTTRTVLTSDSESIAERRTTGRPTESRTRYNEPTVELGFNPHDDPAARPDRQPPATGAVQGQAVGRWWSGQPDDDETLEDEAPWAADKTVENKQPTADQPEETPERRSGPFRRRRSDPDAGSTRRPPR